MIPHDAIAIITPHGRYQRVMRGRRQQLICGHHTAMDEIAWERDGINGDADELPVAGLPAQVCNPCMKRWMEAFVIASQGRSTWP